MRHLAATVLTLLVPAACLADEWDEVRRQLVEPLNAMLHRNHPSMLASRNLDALVRLYATPTGTGLTWNHPVPHAEGAGERTLHWTGPPGEEPIRERYRRLLELFASIDKAELRIDRVDWGPAGPLGRRAPVHLIIRGTGPDGDRRQLEQRATLQVRFYDPFWEITAEEVTARSMVTAAQPRFTSVGKAVGISGIHANRLSPPFVLFGKHEENPARQSSGLAVGDVDGDGCEDLLLAGSPELGLHRNRCDGTFEDVTVAWGLPRPYPAAASGAVFFDYDNDGWADLFVTAARGGDRLFRNTGKERFVEVTTAAGVPTARWGSMPVVADYDRDSFLDVYVVRMGDHSEMAPRPSYDARNGVRGTLLRNRGDGSFEDVSARAGVDSRGWDMAGAWGDYDGDGWPDLYVSNEFGNNRLYHNEGDGTFSDRTRASGTLDGGSGMGTAWGDYDADGDLDLFVSGMHANSRWILFHPAFPAPMPWHARVLRIFAGKLVERVNEKITDNLSRGSTLFRNEGNGTFTDVSLAAGVRDGQWGWGAEFLDYDNDGRLDLYAVNGFISGPVEDDL